MKKYLVTGGAGFIGSHIVTTLVEKGHYVRVLDNFSSGKEGNLKSVIDKIEIVKGDIRSMDDCLKASQGMDHCLHQAALRSVPKSMVDPFSYNDVNINGVLNMLKASVENKIKSFVFASSSSVYGDIDTFPEKETFFPEPISPYALSKLAGEYYCKIFSTHFKLATASLRYFNVFGPRQALDDEYAVVIPKFINCIMKDENPPIFGNGKQSRDFTFVSNVVEANILASGKADLKAEVYNVAGGKDQTVLELVAALNKIMNKNIKPVFLPVRAGDVFKTQASLAKSKKKLGYSSKVGFVEGLRATVDYFRSL